VLPGAYALLAWLVAGTLILLDGMIWGELGAALPAAGGSYHFLLECYGRRKWGRLMAFLFVWQILLSGPLEVGSGLVAVAQFSKAVHPKYEEFDKENTHTREVVIDETTKPPAEPGGEPEVEKKTVAVTMSPSRLVGFAFGVLILALLYRKVTDLGRLSVAFLLGVLALLGWVLVEGAIHFNSDLAFDTQSKPKDGLGPALGLGMGYAIYAYLGYYNVCYLGAEVREPAKTIPRAILLSALAVVVLFTLVQLSVTGAIPWQDAAKETDNLTAAYMARFYGEDVKPLVTVLLVGSCFASCFSGLLGYSRVPFAAAREGHFFAWFAAVHPRLHIPHRSLLLVGGLVLFWSFFSLDAIITALIVTRILEQFVAQVFAVVLLRRLRPDVPRPWRMWLYPLPCVGALLGWLYVYVTSQTFFVLVGLGTLLTGLVVFFGWSYTKRAWPFAPADSTRPILPTSRD
jgi:amino acid transporter